MPQTPLFWAEAEWMAPFIESVALRFSPSAGRLLARLDGWLRDRLSSLAVAALPQNTSFTRLVLSTAAVTTERPRSWRAAIGSAFNWRMNLLLPLYLFLRSLPARLGIPHRKRLLSRFPPLLRLWPRLRMLAGCDSFCSTFLL